MADFVVSHSLVQLPDGRYVSSGAWVTDTDLGETKDRYVEAGAVREPTNEEREARKAQDEPVPPEVVNRPIPEAGATTPEGARIDEEGRHRVSEEGVAVGPAAQPPAEAQQPAADSQPEQSPRPTTEERRPADRAERRRER